MTLIVENLGSIILIISLSNPPCMIGIAWRIFYFSAKLRSQVMTMMIEVITWDLYVSNSHVFQPMI